MIADAEEGPGLEPQGSPWFFVGRKVPTLIPKTRAQSEARSDKRTSCDAARCRVSGDAGLLLDIDGGALLRLFPGFRRFARRKC
jgi:hypothetical protein